VGVEIERKFRVRGDGWRAAARASRRLVQGYVVAERDRSVRVRLADDAAHLTLKGAARGAVRDEWEYAIPSEDARRVLETLCGDRVVEKTRHEVPCEGRTFEVDEFHGANAGLVVAELELEREDAEVPRPAWLGDEITHDTRYLNASLALHPWRSWGADG
jgi:adenylate cyclase